MSGAPQCGNQSPAQIFNFKLAPRELVELIEAITPLVLAISATAGGTLTAEQLSAIAASLNLDISGVAGLQGALDQLQTDINNAGGGALQPFIGTFTPDVNANGFTYLGGTIGDTEVVLRDDRNNGYTRTRADALNNPTFTDLDTAFDNRETLTYG